MTLPMQTSTFAFPNRLGNVIYEADYFAGSQVLVYFSEILVDDIIRIGWSVTQNRTPIYGYASQYFKALAAGNVLGQGSFWVAFKESAYIPLILRYLSVYRTPGEEPMYMSPAGSEATSLAESARLFEGRGMTEGGARRSRSVRRANIERILESRTDREDDPHSEREMQSLLLQMGAMNDRDFENTAEMFEDALWYGGNSLEGRRQLLSGNYEGGFLEDEPWLAFRRGDQYPPFGIIVTFGDINNPAANHTSIRMMDVTIMNTEFEGIQPTGEPIVTRYDFVCRNIA